jgi:putative ABC transport system substrate-binding protein
MMRREFMSLLGGAAVAWPLPARAQQRQPMRRIGVLMHLAADDPEGQSRVAAFLQGLQEAGWAVGRNVNIEVRWAAGEADRYRRYAMEIVALAPDVILTSATPSIMAMQQATGNPHRTDRVRIGPGCGWHRHCRKPVAPGRQRHRLHFY